MGRWRLILPDTIMLLEVYIKIIPAIVAKRLIPTPARAPKSLPTLNERLAAPELEVVEVEDVVVPLRRSAFPWKAAKLFADDSTAFKLNTMPAPQ